MKIKSLAWKNSFLCAWKFTANTWKLAKKSTWKIQTVRESFEKSVREKRLPYVKKMKKWPKKRFTHTFYFHVGKKKHCIIFHLGDLWSHPPGSKCKALRLGVHLILLYFIMIPLLTTKILFFYLGVGGASTNFLVFNFLYNTLVNILDIGLHI